MNRSIQYDRYLLLGRLATGGMAEIFLAKHVQAAKEEALFALKRILPNFSKDPDFVSMFNDEARIASSLQHPNICEIYDQGRYEDQLFMVMEFIHGKDINVLRHRAKDHHEYVPYHITAYIITKIAEALDFAHQKSSLSGEHEGIVHRDISPQNILIGYDGLPKLIDFGVAKAKFRLSETHAGRIKGKFSYMSPEQARGRYIDHRSDIFALGIVLYELLTDGPPFPGDNQFAILSRIVSGNYIPPKERRPDLPETLVQIINNALAYNIDQRYRRAADLARDLKTYMQLSGNVANEEQVAAYMQRLFQQDYLKERQKIKELLDIPEEKPPTPTPTFIPENESTDIMDTSYLLAAGYQDQRLSDPDAETVGSASSFPKKTEALSTNKPLATHPIIPKADSPSLKENSPAQLFAVHKALEEPVNPAEAASLEELADIAPLNPDNPPKLQLPLNTHLESTLLTDLPIQQQLPKIESSNLLNNSFLAPPYQEQRRPLPLHADETTTTNNPLKWPKKTPYKRNFKDSHPLNRSKFSFNNLLRYLKDLTKRHFPLW